MSIHHPHPSSPGRGLVCVAAMSVMSLMSTWTLVFFYLLLYITQLSFTWIYMFAFIGRCMRMSVASLLICTNQTLYAYTRIVDSTYNIRSGEYIHATLESNDPRTTVYTIGILFGRSFKPDMSGRRLAAVSEPNILTLRISYNDSSPGVSVTELETGMWDAGSGLSVDRIFNESSVGQVNFDRETSLVASLRVNLSIASTRSAWDGCDTTEVMQFASQAAARDGIDTRMFAHVEYVLPYDFGSTCDFVELSTSGCSVPDETATECAVILRGWDVVTRARGLGYNYGMLRAGGCGLATRECSVADAGTGFDATAIMGASNTVVGLGGFIAPNRMNMGWLRRVSRVSGDGKVAIRALASQSSVDDAAIVIPCTCPVHAAMGDSCIVVLSYRSPVGIDATIDGSFARSVSVHVASATGRSETALVSILREGESHVLLTGKVLFVCVTGSDTAVVAFGDKKLTWVDACNPRERESVAVIVVIAVFGLVLVFVLIFLAGSYFRRRNL